MARILKQDAKRLMADVAEEYVFRCRDGSIFRNMQELGEALSSMTDDTYAFHANTDNNDFNNWVRDVIKDDKLARDLYKSVDRSQASRRVAERIVFLKEKLA